MRIFYAVPRTPHQSQLSDSNIWWYNLYLPLIDLGHEVVTFDFDYTDFNYNLDPADPEQKDFILRNRPRFGKELLNQVTVAHREKPIDLFFSYFYSSYVEPEAIQEISNMGIVTVNLYYNASYQFHLIEEIAPAYDYCLVPEKFRLEDYKRIGANPIYCQGAANPNIYKPYPLPLEFDVTFVGQKYGERPVYISYLLDKGIDVRVWGPHWKDKPQKVPLMRRTLKNIRNLLLYHKLSCDIPPERCGPPLSDEDLIKMYSRSKISLGFSSVAELPKIGKPIKQVRLRDFEAPMSGAFYMVEYFDEITEFFKPDKEIVCYRNPKDMAEKIQYYLENDGERERIRQAGMNRARTEHTWHKRFETVFRQMGLT